VVKVGERSGKRNGREQLKGADRKEAVSGLWNAISFIHLEDVTFPSSLPLTLPLFVLISFLLLAVSRTESLLEGIMSQCDRMGPMRLTGQMESVTSKDKSLLLTYMGVFAARFQPTKFDSSSRCTHISSTTHLSLSIVDVLFVLFYSNILRQRHTCK